MKKVALATMLVAALLTLPVAAREHVQQDSGASATDDTSQADQGNASAQGDSAQAADPTDSPQKPDGATARCGDGTWSSSHNRTTCSGHGGVAEWQSSP